MFCINLGHGEVESVSIGFIGAGKVGISFGKFLAENQIPVIGYASRSNESAEKAAVFTGGQCFDSVEELAAKADIIFITTPDTVISSVANELAGCKLRKGQIFLHMSGGLSSGILKPVKEKGCFTASLHPLQAFADINKAVVDLRSTFFSLEGDTEAINIAEQLLKQCGNPYAIIQAEKKPLYHSAACAASNYLVSALYFAQKLLDAAGISSEVGIEALIPLASSSIENVKRLGAADAITGPISRGDVNTVNLHMKAIKEHCPELLKLYSCLGKQTLELASKKKLKDDETIKQINDLWRDENE